MCSCQAATGSGRSTRVISKMACHNFASARPGVNSGKILAAQAGLEAATTHQLIALRLTAALTAS
jgi:hypothetical protein